MTEFLEFTRTFGFPAALVIAMLIIGLRLAMNLDKSLRPLVAAGIELIMFTRQQIENMATAQANHHDQVMGKLDELLDLLRRRDGK